MTTNSPARDAAMNLAGRVGSNFKTLRDNKRKLATSTVVAVAVEGFGWTDTWANVKKEMGFAKLEKPEQNQINVFGSALKTIVLAWPTLTAETTVTVEGKPVKMSVRDAFAAGHIVYSTLAASIKDAEKAADKAEADKEATAQAGEDASLKADADHAPKVDAAPVADRSAMIAEVAAMFEVDADAATMTPGEIAAMLDLIAKVDAFKAATIANAKAA